MATSLKSKFSVLTFIVAGYLISLIPLLCFRYFPTFDGPAHLYNAAIIRDLISSSNSVFSDFFEFSTGVIPNWTGHAIMALSGLAFPAWIQEKSLLLIIIVSLPLSIGVLLRAYGRELHIGLLLMLPFVYTLVLYLGFFNFLIALPLMIAALAVFRMQLDHVKFKKLITLFLLVQMLFLSHLMIFLFTIMLMVFQFWFYRISNHSNMLSGRRLISSFAAFLPGILLTVFFYFERGVSGYKNEMSSFSISELFHWFYSGACFTGLNDSEEGLYSVLFASGILLVSILICFKRIKSSRWFDESDFLFWGGFVTAILYFIIPNESASGGFISFRLLLIFYLCISVWIIMNAETLPLLKYPTAILGLLICFSTLGYRFNTTKELSRQAGEVCEATGILQPGTVLLPINYSDNWLHGNISAYMGAANNIVVLDNYEALQNHFPLRWRNDLRPDTLAGTYASSRDPVIDFATFESVTAIRIDAVSRWGFKTEKATSVGWSTDSLLNAVFLKRYAIGECEIFYERR